MSLKEDYINLRKLYDSLEKRHHELNCFHGDIMDLLVEYFFGNYPDKKIDYLNKIQEMVKNSLENKS